MKRYRVLVAVITEDGAGETLWRDWVEVAADIRAQAIHSALAYVDDVLDFDPGTRPFMAVCDVLTCGLVSEEEGASP